MKSNVVFNIVVCVIGIFIMTIHAVNLIIKKGKRKDERMLLYFFVFTVIHFAVYLTFALIKEKYTSNTFVTTFYTVFYIMNNVEVFLLFLYALILSNKHSA